MRPSPTLLAMEPPAEAAQNGVDEIIRTLTELIETASRGQHGIEPSGNAAEEVLVDTEVDGARYLLLRMKSCAWWPRVIPTK
jgi:hypothetical protein